MKRSTLFSGVLAMAFLSVSAQGRGPVEAPKIEIRPIDMSIREAAGSKSLESVVRKIGELDVAKRAEVHAAIKASEAKLSEAEQRVMDERFKEAFKPGATEAERNAYYHSAIDAMARVRSVRMNEGQYVLSEGPGKLADVFRALKFTETDLSRAIPQERKTALQELARLGDPSLAQGILRLSDRQDLVDSAAGSGTSNLKEVTSMVSHLMSARDGQVYTVNSNNGKSGPQTEQVVRGFADPANELSKVKAQEATGTIQNLLKVLPTLPITAAEVNAVMRQIGESITEMSSPEKADAALAQLRGLTSSYEAYGRDLRKNLAHHQANAEKALPTEKIEAVDTEGKPVTMKDAAGREIVVVDGLTKEQRKALNEVLKGMDMERPIAEIMAEVEGRLRNNKDLKTTDVDAILHLLRERAVKSVVEKIFRLEASGRIAKGSTEQFFCMRDPETGQYCMNLEARDSLGQLGRDSFLRKAFAMCGSGGAKAGAAKPAGGRSNVPAHKED